ncbi:uncharacterized protein [Onthophagus taurus]|uniref:uncharacterized protein n=1 Tax=Onthophagus taurus TaxID=166361 RepID=UPI0039BE7D48
MNGLKKFVECYNIPMRNLVKPWVPTSICTTCRLTLINWNDMKKEVVITPTMWYEPKDHNEDCYFCACDITGCNKKNKGNILYSYVQSVTPAKKGKIARLDKVPPNKHECSLEEMSSIESEKDSDYEDSVSAKDPELFDQDSLDDLIRDLILSKDSAELLASRLKERHMLLPGTKITAYRRRDEEFLKYFSSENSLVYCNDIEGLINTYQVDVYKSDDWLLFTDSSKERLKAVLLNNGNKYAAIPIGHSTRRKESHEDLQFVLEKINYNIHNWFICGDYFKMINILVSLQSGNTKNPCFLCIWDSRAREQHWIKKKWPERFDWKVGSNNVVYKSLVDTKRILLPPLHIKLGLIKQFV